MYSILALLPLQVTSYTFKNSGVPDSTSILFYIELNKDLHTLLDPKPKSPPPKTPQESQKKKIRHSANASIKGLNSAKSVIHGSPAYSKYFAWNDCLVLLQC